MNLIWELIPVLKSTLFSYFRNNFEWDTSRWSGSDLYYQIEPNPQQPHQNSSFDLEQELIDLSSPAETGRPELISLSGEHIKGMA